MGVTFVPTRCDTNLTPVGKKKERERKEGGGERKEIIENRGKEEKNGLIHLLGE
jgi:hypothetical protein